MFGKKRSEPELISEPASDPVPDPDTDIEKIKAWIADIAGPKFQHLEDREQQARDGISDVNSQCKDNRDETQKLWIEKDKEHESLVKEITRLNKENRDLRTELAGKANRAKPDKT